MFFNKKEMPQCDFGQYENLWGVHRNNCKKIIRITADYIVYIDRDNNIDWESTDVYDSMRPAETSGAIEKSLSQCMIAEHKPLGGLNESSILSYKTIVGEAIVNCLESNCDESVAILRQAEEFRIDRLIEKSREWYLTFTVLISSVVILTALLINSKSILVWAELSENINIGAWAVAGACLSIILRSGRLKNASYSGKKLHFIESACRIIAGFISGQIVYLGIKSGILFSGLLDQNKTQTIISFLALLAGASERFAPSIITKIEATGSFTEIGLEK